MAESSTQVVLTAEEKRIRKEEKRKRKEAKALKRAKREQAIAQTHVNNVEQIPQQTTQKRQRYEEEDVQAGNGDQSTAPSSQQGDLRSDAEELERSLKAHRKQQRREEKKQKRGTVFSSPRQSEQRDVESRRVIELQLEIKVSDPVKYLQYGDLQRGPSIISVTHWAVVVKHPTLW